MTPFPKLVQRDSLEVIGKSYALIYDYKTITGKNTAVEAEGEDAVAVGPFFFLGEGQKYDLRNRKVIQPARRKRAEPAN
ncbi:hypothetical protein EON80_26970 [bacterium]|nr:MAG: hypothetical protein EON80_26970 [bacterium]